MDCLTRVMKKTLPSWVAVATGILVIVGGFVYSISLGNSGGPPLPATESQLAILVARAAFGTGAAIAIAGPIMLQFLSSRD